MNFKHQKNVISNIFISAAIVMIFTQLVGVIAVNIDGIITSRALGSDAYSSICLLGPLISVLVLLSGFISTGSQIA